MLQQTKLSLTASAARFRQLCLSILLLISFSAATLADDAPPWLRQAASATVPTYDRKVPAVVLLNESRVEVREDGRIRTVKYYAVKILNREGRQTAIATETYLTDSGKTRNLRAWLLRASGAVVPYDKKAVLDVAATNDDLYNEVRVKAISAANDAEVGDVFGFESESEEQTVFLQFDWTFQQRFPTLVSRFSLTGPEQWKIESVTFNRAAVAPTIAGNTHSWELRNLPPLEPEPNSPPVSSLAPRLAVNLFPAANAKNNGGRSFREWAEVSSWLNELSNGQAEPSEAMKAKARELTAGAKNEFERIGALARYVQSVRYISIQTGLGRGGGYRPHAAVEVFARNYGDCKDKANLLRALLKAVGVESYLVSIYSGDPLFVREEWPSPQQFNHCIIAIRVSDETQANSIVCQPKLGRLLFFDPTDEHTPFGELPGHEQDSLALIIAAAAGTLERMPATTPDANRLERHAEISLNAEGAIAVKLREAALGQEAVKKSAVYKSLSRTDYERAYEAFITGSAPGAKVSRIAAQDNAAAGRFTLEVDFAAEQYAQTAQGKMLIFKPNLVWRRENSFAAESARKQPLTLDARLVTEALRITLPAGFEADELPEARTIKTAFGHYSLKCEVKDGVVLLTRELTLRKALVPAEQVAEVADFFARIQKEEQMPLVLIRK